MSREKTQKEQKHTKRELRRIVTNLLVWCQSLSAICLFTFRKTNCVYRFISYQQNRKPIGSPVSENKLLLLLPDNNLTISLPARGIGQRRRATRAPCRCYTAEGLGETLGAVFLLAVSPNAINAFLPDSIFPTNLGTIPIYLMADWSDY